MVVFEISLKSMLRSFIQKKAFWFISLEFMTNLKFEITAMIIKAKHYFMIYFLVPVQLKTLFNEFRNSMLNYFCNNNFGIHVKDRFDEFTNYSRNSINIIFTTSYNLSNSIPA